MQNSWNPKVMYNVVQHNYKSAADISRDSFSVKALMCFSATH